MSLRPWPSDLLKIRNTDLVKQIYRQSLQFDDITNLFLNLLVPFSRELLCANYIICLTHSLADFDFHDHRPAV